MRLRAAKILFTKGKATLIEVEVDTEHKGRQTAEVFVPTSVLGLHNGHVEIPWKWVEKKEKEIAVKNQHFGRVGIRVFEEE